MSISKNQKSVLRAYLVTSFTGDLVLAIFYVYLPLFAHDLGGSTFVVGIVGGANYLTYSFLPFFFGRFSDRIRARALLIVSALALLAVSSVLYAIIPNILDLVIVRLFEGVGWSALWPVIESGIGETAEQNSQKALGIYNFVWSVGAMLGPLLGAVLIFELSIRATFLISAGMILAALAVNLPHLKKRLILQRGIGETKVKSQTEKSNLDPPESLRKLVWKNRILITSNLVVTMAVSTFLTFFPSFGKTIGLSILTIGVLTFTFTASRFLSYLAVLGDKIRKKIISHKWRNLAALVSMAAASVSGIFLSFDKLGLVSFFLGFVLLGIGFAVATTIIQIAMIVEAHPSQIGAGSGFVESAIGTGSFLGPVIAGSVSGGSIVVPFFVPLLIFLFALAILGILIKR